MKFALVPLLALASAASAQDPVISVSPHDLRTMDTAQLRSLLFGEDAPSFAESWVEGPTRRSRYLSVELATRLRPTAYLSLCAVDVGVASAAWQPGKQREDAALDMSRGHVRRLFALSSERPSLLRGTVKAEDEPCATQPALFPELGQQLVPVSFFDRGVLAEDDADAARFGFAAVRAAQRATGRFSPKKERCETGFTDIPLACSAPADFVGTRSFRDVQALDIRRCGAGGALCVDVTFSRGRGCDGPAWTDSCGEDHVVVETDAQSFEDGETLNEAHVRAITIRAGGNPVP